MPLLTSLLLTAIHRRYERAGLLNNKDLFLIGNETGTFRDYLFNVWYWDMLVFGMYFISLLCTVFGLYLIAKPQGRTN